MIEQSIPAMAFWLLASHAICDFALQSDFIAKGKNRHTRFDPPPGQTFQHPWKMVLPAHGMIHGAGVALVTGIWWLGLAEAVAHCIIDYLKCERAFGMYTDQALHLICKAVWLAIAVSVTAP